MKKFYPFLLLFATLFFHIGAAAHDVIIKGYVRQANGTGMADVPVKILVEAPCTIEHSVTTNTSGFYTDKISCPETIRKVRLRVKNCDGQMIELVKEVPSSNVVEANFTVCTEKLSCVARFSFDLLPSSTTHPFSVKFNSNGSETTSTDKIVERIWSFGDGTELKGTHVDPVHDYEKPGAYKVCLTTKTEKGCTSTQCQTVEIKAACKANFTVEQTPNGVRFNSSSATAAANDPITTRRWTFGDETPALQGHVDPLHVYARTGTYTACLTIVTKNGCESKECKQVVVTQTPGTAAHCTARFSFEQIGPNKFRFNSSQSTGAADDPIVTRRWSFGDETPVLSGHIDPQHEYAHPGTYTVCLVTVTKNGCESKECKQVVVSPTVTANGCAARFSYEQIDPHKFRFNSSLSTVSNDDKVVEMQWLFRDGSHDVTTQEASVVHEFEKPGTYEVCLKIRTDKGCESRFCLPVRLEEGAYHPEQANIKIVSLFPAPVHDELKAVIYSKQNNVPATLSILDVYGQVKWSKQVVLAQGNNPFVIRMLNLLPGPYFFRVSSQYGTQTKSINKL